MHEQPPSDNAYFRLPLDEFESVSQLARWIGGEVRHRDPSVALARDLAAAITRRVGDISVTIASRSPVQRPAAASDT